VAAAATFALIFVGGLVTSTGSAMAVPDWPLAFGRLIPKEWSAGVPFEYGHRVVAGTVTILTLVLALWTWMVEWRAWVRYTALAAFGLVVVQAVLGGLTVLFDLPLAFAVAHAATGQAFFCLMVAIAMFTNPSWALTTSHTSAEHTQLWPLAGAAAVVIYFQMLIGAVMRHMHAGLAIPDFPLAFGRLVPPMFSVSIAVNFAHRCGAVVVTLMVVWTAARTFRCYGDEPAIRRTTIGLLALLAIQIALGAATVLSRRAVIPATAHVAVGAAVLATCVALTLRAFNLERSLRVSEAFEVGDSPSRRTGVSARREVNA
jgi:heme a synthase